MLPLRYALRQLRKSAGFTVTATLTLAVAIAVTTVVFSVVYAMLIRPLPYKEPGRIVYLQSYSPSGYTQPASYPEYLDWRRDNHVFTAFAAYNDFGSVNFEGPTGPVALGRVAGSNNFFEVFGVQPILGRTFLPGEDQPGKNNVAVLSYEVWREQLGSNRKTTGETIHLDGRPYTVIGVMPAGFRFPVSQRNIVYTPLNPTRKEQIDNRGNHWLPTIARLKTGITTQQATADMNRVLDDLGRAYPGTRGRRMRVFNLTDFVVGKTAAPLKLLLEAVFALLAVGCANIAALLLARGIKCQREFALRSAVGATRAHLIRQSLTEALVFALLGASAGVALSYVLLKAIRTLLIEALSRGAEVQLSVPVMLAALTLAVLTSIIAAIVPSLELSRIAPCFALRVGGAAGSSRAQHRLRAGFVVSQVALALVLLLTSGLLLRALAGVRSTDIGFSPDHLLACEIDLSPETYKARGDVLTNFYQPLLDRVNSTPGVESAGLITLLPLREWGWNSDTHVLGQPPAPPIVEQLAEVRAVTAGYFQAMDIRLLKGRLLDSRIDTPTSPAAMVVNEAFVKKFLSVGEDPIGKHIDRMENAEIVGVVSNIRQNLYSPPLAEMDFGLPQVPPAERITIAPRMFLIVRAKIDPASLVPSLRNAFHEIDPALPFRQPETMRNVFDDVLTLERLENWLFATFATLALLLAVIGLYGLVAHEVELGTRDIGVRMALGATRVSVLTSIVSRVTLLLLTGLAAGLLLATTGHKLIAAVVTFHASKDARVILLLSATLFFTGIFAALIPARRAAKVDPMVALRYE